VEYSFLGLDDRTFIAPVGFISPAGFPFTGSSLIERNRDIQMVKVGVNYVLIGAVMAMVIASYRSASLRGRVSGALLTRARCLPVETIRPRGPSKALSIRMDCTESGI
jgi:hypothetical protein